MAGKMTVIRDGSLACARVGELWILASGSRPIRDEGWTEYLEAAAQSVESDGPFTGLLIWTPIYGPSAPQRRQLTDDYGKRVRLDLQRRIVVISESTIARGAMTAISWFTSGAKFECYAAKDRDRAITWLALDIPFDRKEAESRLNGMISAVNVEQPRAS